MNILNNNEGLQIKFVDHSKLKYQQSKLKKGCAGCGWIFNPIRSIVFCSQYYTGFMQNGKVQSIKSMLMSGSDNGQQ